MVWAKKAKNSFWIHLAQVPNHMFLAKIAFVFCQKTQKLFKNGAKNRKSEIATPLERYAPQGRPPGEKVSKVSISSRRDAPKV